MGDSLGRNDPCWCGSGKKYKKCHQGVDRTQSGSLPAGGSALAGLGPMDLSGDGGLDSPSILLGAQGKADATVLRRTPLLKERQRNAMREAGRFNAQLLDHVRPHVRAGITTAELDRLAAEYTRKHGHTPACLGYKGYPKVICTSINEVVCHGIPEERALVEGDIVNVDLTTIVDGWHGDQSETFLIGEVSDAARELVQCTFDSLYAAIDALRPGCPLNDIGRAIEKRAAQRYGIVIEYQGHGIGKKFHQLPNVVHRALPNSQGVTLQPGVCFTIEPMLNEGVPDTVLDERDGWTVRTADGKLSAQFEHTILMTEDGPEILTLTEDGPQRGHKFS